jgi:hypothetical protein
MCLSGQTLGRLYDKGTREQQEAEQATYLLLGLMKSNARRAGKRLMLVKMDMMNSFLLHYFCRPSIVVIWKTG